MNGQDRTHTHIAPSGRHDGSSTSAGGGSAPPSGAVTTNSWLRDMMADPVRAAQCLLNPNLAAVAPHAAGLHTPPTASAQHRPPSHSLTSGAIPFTHSLLQGMYNGNSLPAMIPPTIQSNIGQLPSVMPKGTAADHQRLMMSPVSTPVATAGNSTASHPTFSYPYKTNPREPVTPSNDDDNIPAKRAKTLPASAPSSAVQHPAAVSTEPHSNARGPIPHRPNYFHSGSIIQLSENKLKRIEDLQTHDFESSAHLSPNLSLDCSTLVKIVRDPTRNTALLTFSVGDQTHKVMEATVEATLEHPFFVFDQGWSSVCPESTYTYYKMRCKQLKVHDRCISLTFKDNSPAGAQGNTGASDVPFMDARGARQGGSSTR